MFKQQKIQFTGIFATSIVLIILMTGSFWNRCLKSDKIISFWPVIFFLLILISMILLYMLYRRITDEKAVQHLVEKAVSEERTKILTGLENKDKDKETIETEDLEVKAGKLIPSGNFKEQQSFAKKLLSNLAKELEFSQGIFYSYNSRKKVLTPLESYAITSEKSLPEISAGEGLNGQAIQSKEILVIKDIPKKYFEIESGLGKSIPKCLIFIPIVDNKNAIALLELATFKDITEETKDIFNRISPIIAEKFKNIKKA